MSNPPSFDWVWRVILRFAEDYFQGHPFPGEEPVIDFGDEKVWRLLEGIDRLAMEEVEADRYRLAIDWCQRLINEGHDWIPPDRVQKIIGLASGKPEGVSRSHVNNLGAEGRLIRKKHKHSFRYKTASVARYIEFLRDRGL